MQEKYLTSTPPRRLADLAVCLAAGATASAASPVHPAAATAFEFTLGCVAAILVAILVILFLTNRAPVRKQADAQHDPAAHDIVHYARDAIFVIRESGEIIASNPAAEKLFGYPFSELNGKNVSALIPPPTRGRLRANYIHTSDGRELFGVRNTGTQFPADIAVSELPGKQYSLIIRDRSAPSRAQEELEQQRRFVSALVDHLPVLLVVVDHEGRILRFNRACESLTRFSEGEIRGQYLWQAINAPEEMEAAEIQFKELRHADFPARSESVWCLRDNTTRTISWTHNALRDQYGRVSHLVSAGVDVTDSQLADESRREVEALAAAGRLATGVAHDFNNLLTAITGYSGLALAGIAPGDPARGDIEEIQHASDQGASLTRQLLAFSGNHPRNTRPVNCNEAVRNIERLVRVMAADNIHIDLSLENELPLVIADSRLLEEGLMYLVANAKEAMPNGGTLQIQTGLRTLNRTRLDARPPIGPGEYVTLSVVDTGTGIPPEALPHIFEPFYTTKENPIRNGMGLAMVYGIVRQAEGSIVVHSAPGYGSTFRIFLPLAPDQAGRNDPYQPQEESLHGDETVLLAMENDGERRQLRGALESAGYKVIEARSGLQALEIAHKSNSIIHLLISDVSLPRMSGPALALSVQERMPAIRALFATSRSAEEIERHKLVPQSVLRLDRTFDRRFILLRVRESLAAPSSQSHG